MSFSREVKVLSCVKHRHIVRCLSHQRWESADCAPRVRVRCVSSFVLPECEMDSRTNGHPVSNLVL